MEGGQRWLVLGGAAEQADAAGAVRVGLTAGAAFAAELGVGRTWRRDVKGFEHRAAYAMGVALPVLEVARRRTSFATISGYLDDFLIGALLLYAASLMSRGHPYGPGSLVAAWGVLCGGLYYSFFGQLESPRATDVSGLPNSIVVGVKGVLYGVALYALYRSVYRVGQSRSTEGRMPAAPSNNEYLDSSVKR